jgi:hypothetical protein
MDASNPMGFNKQWLAKLSSPPPLSEELVVSNLDRLQSGREAYLISVLLSLETEASERVLDVFNILKPYDREELSEVMQGYLEAKNAERPSRILTPWGNA